MQRQVASARFVDDYQAIETLALRPAASAGELARNLGEVYGASLTSTSRATMPPRSTRTRSTLSRAIFKLRVRLRDQIRAWHC